MPKKKGKKRTGKDKKREKDNTALNAKRVQLEHDHLYREIQYGAETVRRHEAQWRELLHRLALPHIHEELLCSWHVFEFIIDTKDFTISLLLDELKRADEQYQFLVRAHIDNFDRIFTLWKTQSTALWNDSQAQILALYQAAIVERNELVQTAKENEDFLKTVCFTQVDGQREADIIIHGVNLAQQDVYKTTTEEITSNLISNMAQKYQKLWDEARAFIDQYNAYFSQQAKNFAGLEEEDAKMSKQIQNDWKHIEASYMQIHFLYESLDVMKKEHLRKLASLTDEFDHYNNIFATKKLQLRKDKVLDLDQLTFLTTESNKVIDEMHALEKEGELLLSMIGICRKLETPGEKIRSFPIFEGSGSKKKTETKKNARNEDEPKPGVTKYLDLFWNHLAALEVSRYDLNAQCNYLRNENEMLKKRVTEYCEALDCEPQVLFLYENSNLLK